MVTPVNISAQQCVKNILTNIFLITKLHHCDFFFTSANNFHVQFFFYELNFLVMSKKIVLSSFEGWDPIKVLNVAFKHNFKKSSFLPFLLFVVYYPGTFLGLWLNRCFYESCEDEDVSGIKKINHQLFRLLKTRSIPVISRDGHRQYYWLTVADCWRIVGRLIPIHLVQPECFLCRCLIQICGSGDK